MIYTDNLDRFYTDKRIWQGIPGIERTKNGKLFATFYSGGVKEEFGNFCVLITSLDDGESWSEPIAVAYNGEQSRCFDPCLWIDPVGRLWFFWAVMPEGCVYCSVCDNPDMDKLSWSNPRPIAPEVMMNKPIVLSTGEWLLPITEWPIYMSRIFNKDREERETRPYVYKSTDMGESFVKCGGPIVDNRSFDEHMVIECSDGKLAMYTRTKYGISESFSYDGGSVWTRAHDSKWGGPDSRFCVRRLKSGRLILINHYKFTGRNNLTAMLSEDDGKTWRGFLTLDERSNVSYPDLVESDDGYIYVIYDRERGGFLRSLKRVEESAREILLAKFTEEDVLSGKLVSEGCFLKKIINKLEGASENAVTAFAKIEAEDQQNYIGKLMEIDSADELISRIFGDYGINCASVTVEVRDKIDKFAGDIITDFADTVKRKYAIGVLLDVIKCGGNSDKNLPNYIVDRVFSYIKTNFAQDFTLSELSSELNVSLYYMCHLFKQSTGLSIVQYRMALRLYNAKKMLVESSLPINEIAMSCGFATSSYFSEIFKREENLTPQDYRELHKK